ncbi:MAG: hypothetical protein K0R54_4179 [Clostridiaceae bacterium]|jgi:hypothetical protein|nr:hypothetical protein [Clostridiaceae bacterium]
MPSANGQEAYFHVKVQQVKGTLILCRLKNLTWIDKRPYFILPEVIDLIICF